MSMHAFSSAQTTSLQTNSARNFSRRHFLKTSLGMCTLLTLPYTHAYSSNMNERKLAFLNLHTGERTNTTYWAEGAYLEEGLLSIETILRDHRTGETYKIDHDLLDILHLLNYKTATQNEFHVISGYRSPKTNAQLSARSDGVAKRSLHMSGQAIDLRLPGYALADLRNAALSLQSGGVGYYPRSDFIHIDTGRIRQWSG